jgi:hypothetical protein
MMLDALITRKGSQIPIMINKTTNQTTNNEAPTATPNVEKMNFDLTDDEQFDKWLEATSPEEKENDLPQDNKPESGKPENIGSQPETNEARIAQLEKEIEKERKTFNESRERGKKLDAAAWKKFTAKVAETTDLKQRVKRELEIKAQYREKFLADSFASESDFERLWSTKLRDEALLAEMADKQAIAREHAKHSIYSTF